MCALGHVKGKGKISIETKGDAPQSVGKFGLNRSVHALRSLVMAKTEDGEKSTLFCSFCGKAVMRSVLIAGPTVFICDECVELCMDIIREE